MESSSPEWQPQDKLSTKVNWVHGMRAGVSLCRIFQEFRANITWHQTGSTTKKTSIRGATGKYKL